MDFEYSERTMKLRREIEEFMDAYIYPNEDLYYQQLDEGDTGGTHHRFSKSLRAEGEIRWPLEFVPPESERGAGLTNMEYTPLCEIMGKGPFCRRSLQCSAPDTGNMETIERYGTEEHKNNGSSRCLRAKFARPLR